MIEPLELRPLLALGDWAADGAPGLTTGRLNCIPWPMFQVPAWERWKIDVIHMNNWADRDATYSLTIEAAGYDRAAVSPVFVGLRATANTTIRWGENLEAGQNDRLLGPWWANGGEWVSGAAIPGLSAGLINCHIVGWRYS